ncbi:hypothetical protein BSKO_00596 [Bryopsis sp. KO-2023]|nr:hypothetical protein BSKO_00596 [Bryopsis sp. KO-2023]
MQRGSCFSSTTRFFQRTAFAMHRSRSAFSCGSDADESGFKILSEESMHSRYLKVSNRKVAYPKRGDRTQEEVYEYDVVSSRHPHFCVVFPFHSAKPGKPAEVTVLREYCQGPHSLTLSLPAGGFDPQKHHSKEECAQQELSEEAQLVGGKTVPLLPPDHPGFPEVKWCANRFTPFLLIDPEEDSSPLTQDAEEYIEVLRVSVDEFKRMMVEGNMLPPSIVTANVAFDYLIQHGFL